MCSLNSLNIQLKCLRWKQLQVEMKSMQVKTVSKYFFLIYLQYLFIYLLLFFCFTFGDISISLMLFFEIQSKIKFLIWFDLIWFLSVLSLGSKIVIVTTMETENPSRSKRTILTQISCWPTTSYTVTSYGSQFSESLRDLIYDLHFRNQRCQIEFCLIILLRFEYLSHDTIILFFSFLQRNLYFLFILT